MFRASQIYGGDRGSPKQAPPPRPQFQRNPNWNAGAAQWQKGGGKEYWGGGGGKGSGGQQWQKGQQVPPRRPPVSVPPPRLAAGFAAAAAGSAAVWTNTAATGLPVKSEKTIMLQGPGLSGVGERAIDSACRQIAIDGGFSVHESVCLLTTATVHVDFPHGEAAAAFEKATGGSLEVGGRSFTVQQGQKGTWGNSAPASEDDVPTDTLMVKHLHADVKDADLLEAFAKVAPRIRAVKLPKTFSGQSKGHGLVTFYEVYEASAALRHFREKNILVGGRRVVVEYLAAQSVEDEIALEEQQKKSANNAQQAHAQALQGPNADMWASYLQMFNSGGEVAQSADEPEVKRMRF